MDQENVKILFRDLLRFLKCSLNSFILFPSVGKVIDFNEPFVIFLVNVFWFGLKKGSLNWFIVIISLIKKTLFWTCGSL